jgi:hypothetical protein
MPNRQIVEDQVLAKAVSDEKIVISSEAEAAPSVEKIAERKTIVYETRIDPTVIKVAGEKVKDQLFSRFGFRKPRAEDIQLISIDKYYEPYLVISGKYFIDYYRKCIYTVKVDKKVLEVILLDRKLEPNEPTDSSVKDYNVLRLEGEERLMSEFKTSLILDKYGKEITLEKLPSAPSERNPKKILKEFGIKEIPPEADLNMIRSRIIRRPKDISRLVSELFEVSERAVIYTPRFKVKYRNLRTREEKAVEFDGVTAERTQRSFSLPQI